MVALARIAHPIGLEAAEEGVAALALRVRAGLPLYAAPSAEHVALVYPPLQPWLGAAALAVFGDSLATLRALSLLATGVTFVLLHRLAGGGRAGWIAVGLLAAAFDATGAWFDLARVDMVAVALTLASVLALRRSVVFAAVLAVAATLAKQAALPVLVAAGVAAVLAQGRRGGWFLACLGAGVGLAFGALHLASEGWSTYFLWQLPAEHPWLPAVAADALLLEPARAAGLLVLAVLGGVAAWRRERRAALVPIAFAVAAYGLGLVQRLRDGGWHNVLIPGYAALAWLAALAWRHGESRRELVALVVLAQMAMFAFDPSGHVPSARERANAEALVAELRAIDGPVFAPTHTFALHRAGKPLHADGTALWDLDRSRRRDLATQIRRELDAQWQRGDHRALLLDSPGYREIVGRRFPVVRPAYPDGESGHTSTPHGFERLWWYRER